MKDINLNMESNMSNQSTIIEPTIVLSDDKIELYKNNIKKVLPFTESTNKYEKKVARDFVLLLKYAINKTENYVLLLLKNAIEHVISYFSHDFEALINKQIEDSSFIGNYELLNDIVVVITQTILHKQNIREFSDFCLNM